MAVVSRLDARRLAGSVSLFNTRLLYRQGCRRHSLADPRVIMLMFAGSKIRSRSYRPHRPYRRRHLRRSRQATGIADGQHCAVIADH